jgi:hypothetical protein
MVAAGYGKDTSETTALNKSSITATTDTEAITFAGSYQPKLRHKITLATRGNADVVRIEHVTTGDYIDVDLDGFTNGDYLEIDEENQTVKKNGTTNLNYRGKFPTVIIGANSLKLTVYGSSSTLDQEQTANEGGDRAVIYDSGVYLPWQAQSFVPTQSGRLHKLNLYVDKVDGGTLSGAMQFLIFSDNNGVPGSNLCGSWGYEISHANVPTSVAWTDAVWTDVASNEPFLTAGKRYWIVLNPSVIGGSDINNFYGWYYNNVATGYLYGKAMAREGSVAAWEDAIGNAQTDNVLGQFDTCFKNYRGADGGAASHSITWQIYYTKKYL